MVSPKWRLVVHHTWNKTLNNPNFTRKEFVFWMDINNKVSHLYDDFKILLLVLWFSSLRKFQHDSIPNRSVSYPFPDLLFHDLIKLRFQNVWFEPLNFAEFFGKIKFLRVFQQAMKNKSFAGCRRSANVTWKTRKRASKSRKIVHFSIHVFYVKKRRNIWEFCHI